MIQLPEDYIERPPKEELDLVSRMHGRFKGTGYVMPPAQNDIYKGIRDSFIEDVKLWRGFPKHIFKPTVCDVGCGLGIGSNILSQEAQFVWGIDSNKESIGFAKQLFERVGNEVYSNPQVTFDVINAGDELRGLMEFDYVTCIEVIEHIPKTDTNSFLSFINRLVKKDKRGKYVEDSSRTKIFITTPNRNAPTIQKDTPRNEHHCWEATASEMYTYLTEHYRHVTVMDKDMNPQELDTQATPLVYKCEIPL